MAPRIKLEHTRNGCTVTITTSDYKTTAIWSGACDSRGMPRFYCSLKHTGFEDQKTWFSLGAGMYPDDKLQVAELTLHAFTIGRGDVDEEFFTPHQDAWHDEKWIAENCVARQQLCADLDHVETRLNAQQEKEMRRRVRQAKQAA